MRKELEKGGQCANHLPSSKKKRAVAQLGSALEWGSRGRWFESSRPDFSDAAHKDPPLSSKTDGTLDPVARCDCMGIR
jgi:hypothetical protein